MLIPSWLSGKAEALMAHFGLSYEHFVGLRYAVNVFIATTIVWFVLAAISDTNPIWAIASVVAASDPEPAEAGRMFRSRLVNVLVGCAVGMVFLFLGGGNRMMIPLSLAVAVLISTYLVRVKTMWRQAPITAAIVTAGAVGHSAAKPFEVGLHKVEEVIFGCMVGVTVSWLMSKVQIVKKPAAGAKA